MNKRINDLIKDIALEELNNSKLGDKLQKAMKLFENVQEHINAFAEKEGDEQQTLIKAATVMTFSILNKIASGTEPSKWTKDDWKDIAKDVSEYAILQDDQRYVEFVFCLYERYIRYSAIQLETFVSEEKVESVLALADELVIKTELLENDEIKEVNYVEDCLWICLEAMIKLIAIRTTMNMASEYAELGQAVAMYAFEYGRFKLYRREQELLTECLESQYKLDEELEKKYETYKNELEKEVNEFYTLIDNAFTPNFRENFLYSIKLAEVSGVEEKEVLKSMEEIDEFFM